MMACTSWSPAAIVARLGGDEPLARQLVTLFLAECPRMVAAVRESLDAGVADDLRRAAHTLKGSMSNFLDGAPVTTAFAIEQLAAASQLAEAVPAVEQLEREVENLLALMREFQGT